MPVIGEMNTNMLAVAKSNAETRKCIRTFTPQCGLTIVNYKRCEELDQFYLECQEFRDYYRDSANQLPRPGPFRRHYGRCGKRSIDKLSALLRQPVRWVAEKKPVVCPLPTFTTDIGLDDYPAQYSTQPSFVFKR